MIDVSKQLFETLLDWAIQIWDLVFKYDVFTWVMAGYVVRKALVFFNIIKP